MADISCRLSPRTGGKKASVLMLALWSLSLLAVFCVYMGYGVRQKMSLTARLYDISKMRQIAEAGVKSAVALLNENDTSPGVDALKDGWSSNKSRFFEKKVGEGAFTLNGSVVQSRDMLYGLVDEQSKININEAGEDILIRLFNVVGGLDAEESKELADSYLDWIDSDSETRTGGAEDFYYTGLYPPYNAKNSKVEVLEELVWIKGMSIDLFNRLKEYVTVYTNGAVNINTAPKAVFMAMGLPGAAADKIILFRAGDDQVEGTEDDRVFAGVGDAVAQLSQFQNMSASEIAEVSNFISANVLCVSSEVFMINSVASLGRKDSRYSIVCVVKKNELTRYGTGTRIVRWTED